MEEQFPECRLLSGYRLIHLVNTTAFGGHESFFLCFFNKLLHSRFFVFTFAVRIQVIDSFFMKSCFNLTIQ